jgi:polar amino acid transport system substrate-binding protein
MGMGLRKLVLGVAIAVALVGTLQVVEAGAVRVPLWGERLTLAWCAAGAKFDTLAKGRLTIATSSPSLPPWFVADHPGNGRGYESALAYRVASLLGFAATKVTWYSEPYELSEAPGPKPFDVDVDEIVYNPTRASDVAFSRGYFNVNQSLVALRSDAVVTHHAPADLRTYRYGDVVGSPGLAFITQRIKPTRAPTVYATLGLAIQALQSGAIDAVVIDTPTGQYLASQQLTGGVQVAQFHTTSEHYSMVLPHGSPLTACVNLAIRSMTRTGELAALSKRYLAIYNRVPVIAP